jgi:DNA primase
MNHIEEIRLRMNIEDLVGSYVQLKKSGRNLRGLCPFHGEKTPSFMVSPEKGIAYCFGCHQGGDIFKFIQTIENVSFGEAVKILADKTGVILPRELPKENNKRLKGIEINDVSVGFYEEQLWNSRHKEYFLNRGLTEETIKFFRLGYAPDSFDQLKNYLLKKNFDRKDLIEASVVNQRSIADQNIYDRFRNRLIFPIFDHQDNPVGFSGRIIGEGEPKYLNSPETPAYNKSLILYGLNWAKESIKEEGIAIFVEGYMDVISSHQAGVKNVVATCGTALTPQQLKLIQRYTKKIAFAFDGDGAGMSATLRAIELAQMADIDMKVILIPVGKDPDECVQKNPDEWRKAVKNPVTIMDFYFAYALKQHDKEELEGKKQIINFLLPLIRLYKSDVERSIYLNRLALELKTDVRLLWSDLKKVVNKPSYQPENKSPDIQIQKKKIFSREEFLLGFIFSYPEMYEKVAKNLIDNIKLDPETEKFYNALKKVYTRESSVTIELVKEELSEEDQDKIGIYALMIDEAYTDFSEDSAEKEIQKLVKEINRKNIYNVQKEFEFSIRISQDPQEKKILLNQYNELLKLAAKI